jgi:Lecithin retinol acyltransferase
MQEILRAAVGKLTKPGAPEFGAGAWPSGFKQEPPLGAHLATSRCGYSHHGVYVGRGWMVHYSGLSGFWQCGSVEEVPLSRFANSHPVRIVHHVQSPYSPEEIVRRARSRVGENDYRLLTNNCEHFCNWCVSGVNIRSQVARPLRLTFRVLGALIVGRSAQRRSFGTASRREYG